MPRAQTLSLSLSLRLSLGLGLGLGLGLSLSLSLSPSLARILTLTPTLIHGLLGTQALPPRGREILTLDVHRCMPIGMTCAQLGKSIVSRATAWQRYSCNLDA